MPAYALTEAGTGICNHGGTIAFTGKGVPNLTAGSQKVVNTVSIVGAPVSSCPNDPKCLTVSSASPGSTTLKANGVAAVLATDSLVTNAGTGTITNPGNTTLQGS